MGRPHPAGSRRPSQTAMHLPAPVTGPVRWLRPRVGQRQCQGGGDRGDPGDCHPTCGSLHLMLSSSRLAVIEQIAAHGSIAAAAEALYVTPSAVSHQLSRFEKELGVSLVERGPHSLRLTDAGRRMAEHARAIADLMRAAEDDVTAHAHGRTGRLRIGFSTSGGLRLVPLALSGFVRAHPDVDLALFPGQTHELIEPLAQGDLDLAVVFDHSVVPYPFPTDLNIAPLLDDPLYLVFPAGHPRAGDESVALEDLAGEPWIATHGMPPTPAVLEKLCGGAGFVPDIRCRTDSYDLILGLIRAGLGVGLVPAVALPGGTDNGLALSRISGQAVVRRISAFTRPSNPNPLVPAFANDLTRVAAALQLELNRQFNARSAH